MTWSLSKPVCYTILVCIVYFNAYLAISIGPNATAPRPPTHSSIPALLNALQNEWDALVLEGFTLKQQYHATRQELSYALYAQDAASRVIARIMRERDAARECVTPYLSPYFFTNSC